MLISFYILEPTQHKLLVNEPLIIVAVLDVAALMEQALNVCFALLGKVKGGAYGACPACDQVTS